MMQEGKSRPPHSSDEDSENTAPAKAKRLILPAKIPEQPRKVIPNPDPESSINRNQVIISGTITDLASPRYTPAGLMIAEFKLSHCSNQQEAGIQRRIEFEFEAIAIAETAEKLFV